MKLTPNFYLAEFTNSNYATRHGIKNIPSSQIKQNLQVLANGLEEVRALLGTPILISSGYRNLELNRAIGGSNNSSHMLGYAADFDSNAYGTPKQIVKAIKDSNIEYDQLIEEGNWVHISFDPKQRNQTLSATFKNGKATYRNFV
jgi:zinc D-Ala-D-Ala carboxypeptidase